MKKIYKNTLLVIALIFIFTVGFIFPSKYPIPNIPSGNYNDTICFDCNIQPDIFVSRLLIILIPITIIIGIIVLFYPSKKKE